jgi:hypothetical protein
LEQVTCFPERLVATLKKDLQVVQLTGILKVVWVMGTPSPELEIISEQREIVKSARVRRELPGNAEYIC